MNVTLTSHNMSVLGIDFIEVDFSKPIPEIPEDHFTDYLSIKCIGSGIVPDTCGRWDDVRLYEGQLPEELDNDWKPIVSQFEQDCWDNGIDTDDFQKGPDPYGYDSYQSVFVDALKSHDIMYG